MERTDRAAEVLARLARGEVAGAERACATWWELGADPVAAGLGALTQFWRGDFAAAAEWAGRAREAARDDEARALALAVAALAAAGDLAADGRPAWAEGAALLAAAPAPAAPWWSLVRYLLAEAALVSARVVDAGAVLAGGAPPGDAWPGHPFAPMMHVCDVRSAAFAGDIARATALLARMRSSVLPGERLATAVDAVAGLVLGNADDPDGVRRSIAGATASAAGERDFVDRGVLLLLAFGAIAVGDAAAAAGLVFRAGDDGDLGRCTIIDRALGFELFLVAALAEDDLPAAQTWLAALERLGEHPVSRPTVRRARARLLLHAGDVDAAVAELTESIAACRRDGRGVEAAEGEIVLARARIAARDVAGASRELRQLVQASDATGHHAVRRSAASTLQPARRRLPPVAGGGWEVLSEREREVAEHVLDGREVDEIAGLLFLSPATVRTHVSRVLCAFGVPTRIGLLAAVGPERLRRPDAVPAAPLSARQAEVAGLVAAGATNQQVADALGISVKGVEKHVGDVLARWQVGSRFEVARTWWAERA